VTVDGLRGTVVQVLSQGERHNKSAGPVQRQVPVLVWHGQYGPVDRGDGHVHLLAGQLVGDLLIELLGKLPADRGCVLVLGVQFLYALAIECGQAQQRLLQAGAQFVLDLGDTLIGVDARQIDGDLG
jgi:hypothetical protein